MNHNIKITLEDVMWEKRIKSVNELSRRTGISRPTLVRLINGESESIHLSTISTLCKELGCKVSDLLTYENGQAS